VTVPVSVRGGTGGVEAHCDDMEATARLLGQCAVEAADQALRLHAYLARPELLESGLLDPMGAARFEVGLLDALDGPGGVAVLAARCASLDVGLRAAAQAYRETDHLSTALSPAVAFLRQAPHAGWDAVSTLVTSGDVAAASHRMLTDDPQLGDLATRGLAAVVGLHSVREGARLVGALYPDGRAEVTALGADPGADRPGPPRSLATLVRALARRNDGKPGEIDVRLLTSGAGSRPGGPLPAPRQVIVDIPGTKDWSLARHNDDITSISTNLRALAGTSTSYERGVIQAMQEAGVRPTDDVLLVGHSEGGMVAVNAAIHACESGQFHISHVVTAGAPIGAAASAVPRRVQILALENRGDPVPHLDDAENPDRVNVTTVVVRHDHGSVGANHGLDDSYVLGAADIDASNNGSTRSYLQGLRPFLSADAVSTRTFQITRSYP
jgi:pimeloyl-ACP methyl ester carboxylesterase